MNKGWTSFHFAYCGEDVTTHIVKGIASYNMYENVAKYKCVNMGLVAKRDILRLKSNWLFLVLTSMLRAINYICVIPTNHQFIINPTINTLNITNEVT